MDFGLRDWLLILGPAFIVAVLAHGYWRMRANRSRIKMKLDKSYVTKTSDDINDDSLGQLRAELPNGGARVRSIPQQASLDLEQDVPVLMDPVDEISTQDISEKSISAKEGDFANDDGGDESIVAVKERLVKERLKPKVKKAVPVASELPEKFVVIYVIAADEPFRGQHLLENLVEQRMSYGEMDIFHRLDAADNSLFSLVNAVEPGTFNLNTMADLETPGVSIFMRVHELSEPVLVFNEMIRVARCLADELGGEVKDQSRSVMTKQTIEHCRLDITEYQRKHRQ